MTDIPAAAAAPETPPEPKKQLLNNYEVRCLNGAAMKVASPFDLPTFRHMGKVHGYIPSDKVFIEFEHVVSIEHIGMFDPAANVQPLFGQRPGPQLVSVPKTETP